MPLVNGQPGEGECWYELADHSVTHDDLPVHWHLASSKGRGGAHGLVVAPHVRKTSALKTSAANPLGLSTVPCTGKIIPEGRHAGRCENHAGRFGWLPETAAS